MPGATDTMRGVLVVDDDHAVCRLFQLFLQRLDLAATVAHDRAAAERLLAARPWRLLITDLQLEGASEGLELAALAVSLSPRVPTILVSGYGGPDVADAASRCGADLYLPKPVSFADFSAAVRSLLPPV
ncbi:MAG TPA: response regulator [Thermoanaerobaculia bacterium]|nr:response regulator [Thermoanaerobaculia bacterium]